jgi:hypothetical protein
MLIINRRLLIISTIICVLITLPLIAMQFTNEVKWTISDFLVAAGLLFSAGFACEWALRRLKTVRSRWIACGLVLITLAIIWIELAVGIF